MSKTGISKTFETGDGNPITIETGKLATQADGAVVVRQGNCMILATVVSSKEVKEEDRDQIISDCVDQVLQILKSHKER